MQKQVKLKYLIYNIKMDEMRKGKGNHNYSLLITHYSL
jgi:hypothetical protein